MWIIKRLVIVLISKKTTAMKKVQKVIKGTFIRPLSAVFARSLRVLRPACIPLVDDSLARSTVDSNEDQSLERQENLWDRDTQHKSSQRALTAKQSRLLPVACDENGEGEIPTRSNCLLGRFKIEERGWNEGKIVDLKWGVARRRGVEKNI